jgi:hypothetical protein
VAQLTLTPAARIDDGVISIEGAATTARACRATGMQLGMWSRVQAMVVAAQRDWDLGWVADEHVPARLRRSRRRSLRARACFTGVREARDRRDDGVANGSQNVAAGFGDSNIGFLSVLLCASDRAVNGRQCGSSRCEEHVGGLLLEAACVTNSSRPM